MSALTASNVLRPRPRGLKGWLSGAMLGATPVIESAHPSPMSADRGFFGSKPFSRANDLLTRQGAQPIDWKLP